MNEPRIGGDCKHGYPTGQGCDECAAEQEFGAARKTPTLRRYLVKDTTGEYVKVTADTITRGDSLKFHLNGITVAQFTSYLHWRELGPVPDPSSDQFESHIGKF